MTFYTLQAAQVAVASYSPWCCRVEYLGYNDANKSGVSGKFWQIMSTPSGVVECSYGKLGTLGTTINYTYEQAFKKLNEKVSKGYRYTAGTLQVFQPPAPAALKAAVESKPKRYIVPAAVSRESNIDHLVLNDDGDLYGVYDVNNIVQYHILADEFPAFREKLLTRNY